MKKLLTIVALALVLCLGVSAALAVTFDQLNSAQKNDIANKLVQQGVLAKSEDLLKEANLKKLVFTTNATTGAVTWTYEAGAEKIGGAVIDCSSKEGGAHKYGAVEYTYYTWDAAKHKVASDASKTDALANVPAGAAHYGDVCAVKTCSVCGHKDVQVVTAKVAHYFGDDAYLYTTDDPSTKEKAALAGVAMTEKEVKEWACTHKGNLYKYRYCQDCEYKESSRVYFDAQGKHSYPATAQVIEASTCINHGYEGYKCSVCGWVKNILNNNDPAVAKDIKALPLGDHTYTEKVYEFQVNADKTPGCKTGLIFVYTLKCTGGCGQYEGDLMTPDFVNYGHTETMSLDKAAKLLGWYDDVILNAKAYDEDGHHYTKYVSPESGYSKYACEPGYSETWACEFCGLKKVFSVGEANDTYLKKIVDADKTVYTDCLNATVTYKCDSCEGKVAGHTKTAELVLENTDALAHNGGKYFVEDLSKRVEPTCDKAGSQTLVCTECGYVKTVVLPKLNGHSFGDYALVKVNANNEYVWERACVFCGKTEIKTTATKDKPKDIKWVKTVEVSGTCLEAAYTEYKKVNADGSDAKDDYGKLITKKVYGAYGDHVMAKVENYKDAQKATCSKEGIELWVCTRCTKYNPDTPKAKVLADCMTYLGNLPGGTPYYVVTKTEKLAHTWGEPVVVEATAEKDGSITKTCTVCGEVEVTVVPFEKGAAAYKLADVKFSGNILSGKLVHTAGTKDAENLNIRVTFFLAGNVYMTTTATIYDDLTFEAEGAGEIEAITLVVYDADKVVNPSDVASLTKLDAKEIVVK